VTSLPLLLAGSCESWSKAANDLVPSVFANWLFAANGSNGHAEVW